MDQELRGQTRQPVFAPLANRSYRELWIGSNVSNLGTLIQTVGSGWLMTQLAASNGMVALVQAANVLPLMAFSILAGALADNFDRRTILVSAQVFMLVVSGVLALLVYTGMVTPWIVLALTFLTGCGTALYSPAWQASVGDIVPRNLVRGAVSLNSMGFNLMRSVGPALGGVIVAAFGAGAAFAVNTVSYSALITALMRWKAPPRDKHLPREALGTALSSGLRYVSMSPALMRVMARGALFGLAASSVLALLPVVAADVLKGTALTYGILLGAFGVGAIGGVLASSRLSARLRNEAMVRLAFLGFAIGVEGLAASRMLITSVPALMICGAAWVLALSLFNVTVQLSTPRWVVARALSFYQTATFGGMAAGSWLWGALSDLHGPVWSLSVSGAVLLAGVFAGRWMGMAEFDNLNLDPVGAWREPALKLDLRGRSGPVMVMIDYEIAQEDVEEFLGLMRQRRRIRIRDGARQWALLRDLENPELWTESYHVPTWTDYVRHQERRVQADADVAERIWAMHKGEARPRVHRMIERQTVPVHDDMPLKMTDVT
ncbi:MFS transporter [Solirhodobacter olei]|uniref:MFS transporter n=1 Tax=Solirhodobacter olei TaxID=2493082 RepID=UPI000FDB15D7|nr:MFS transporter [Solirhodobacter olei]